MNSPIERNVQECNSAQSMCNPTEKERARKKERKKERKKGRKKEIKGEREN